MLKKDIGFIAAGQPVRLKFDAFPFTDYGIVNGVVAQISSDAVQDETCGVVYTARVALQHSHIPLKPGLAVQAEIKTAKRRAIQYLLSPIAKRLVEAGRER